MAESRVMIVEDDRTQALVLERQLLSLGHTVVGVAFTGEEAIPMVQETHPDLVLMDIMLGGQIDGIAAAEQVRKTVGTPVIFLTANADDATINRAKDVEPAGYLHKPLQKRELRTAIEVGLYRHATEQRIRESEKKYRSLFDTASDAILISDGVSVVDCNVSAQRMFGLQRDELIGKNAFNVTCVVDRGGQSSHKELSKRIDRVLAGGTERFEWTHRKRDGAPFTSEVVLTCLKLDSHALLQSVIHDIDSRKRAETRLEHERILLRTLIDHLPDCVYVKDREARKTVANLADVRNMGLEAESEVLGKNDFDLFPRELAEKFFADDMTVLRDGVSVVNREEYVVDKEGKKRWLLTTKVPLRDNNGVIIGLVGIGHDVTSRRAAEESLQLFRTLLDRSSDAIEVIDPESGRFLDANEKAWKSLGYRREELLNLSIFDIGPTMGRLEFEATSEHLREAEFMIVESRHRRKDGSEFPVEINLKYVQLDRGFVVAVARDITKRKEAEQVLRESERRLAEIIEFFPLATLVIDRGGSVIAWNRAMEKLTSVNKEQVLWRGNYEYAIPFYGERRPILADFVMQPMDVVKRRYPFIQQDGENVSTEIRTPALGNGEVHLHATATALRGPDGEIIGAIESLLDITARKRAEIRLRESEERFRLISENVADLITVLDAEGMCLYASPSFRQDGIDPEKIIGTSFLGHIHPDDIADVRKLLEQMSAQRHQQVFTFRLGRGDGSWRDKEATASLLVSDAGFTVVAVARDVTERLKQEDERRSLQVQLSERNLELERALEKMQRMQEGLVQSEKMASIGQLTAGIAHEINNPLAFVSSNLNRFGEYFDQIQKVEQRWGEIGELLAGDDRYQLQMKEMAKAIAEADLEFIVEDFSRLMKHTQEGAGRIKSIVERLRGFTHLADSGFADADINAAIDDTLTLTWNELKYKATIVKRYGELPKVECNIGEIKQVLVNLLVNSAHAIAEKGTITIATSLNDSRIVIEVSDTGSGISPMNVKRIFDPFFTTKPVGKGTGLGLWISTTIIQKHRGTIIAQSAEGEGTTMRIEMPVKQTRSPEVDQ